MVLAVPSWATNIAPGNYDTAAIMNNVGNGGTFLTNVPIFGGYQSAAQSIASSSVTALAIDSSIVDSYGGHSNVTNNSRYTAIVAGYYLVIAQFSLAANAAGARLTEIHKNGVGTPVNLGQGGGSAPPVAINSANQVATIVQLAVGDYVEAFAYQTSGGALNTIPAQTGMTVIWLHA